MDILIADDEPRYRELLATLFQKWPQHRLTLAADGREAWELLDDPKRWFDVAILDLNMPHQTGLDLLERLQHSPLHRSMETVICTARNDRDTITKAISLGARHYVVKPWTEKTLATKLTQIAEIRAAGGR